MTRKKTTVETPPKACPRPADFLSYPQLLERVRLEWRHRMETATARRGHTKRRRKPSGLKS